MRIGVDVDGVLYNFHAALREFLISQGSDPATLSSDPVRWDFYVDWGLTLEEFLEAVSAGIDAGVIMTFGDPYPGTREALERMRAAGHTIHIVTDRSRVGTPGSPESATRKWLESHQLPFDSLTFSRDKTVVRTDVMIDDKLENYDDIEATGTLAYLRDQPWNQARDRFRHRVSDLAELADLLLGAEVVNV